MARNFIQPGETITVTAPRNLASGDGVLVGAIFGVALAAATAGTPVEIRRVGVWDLTKATGQSWTQGVKLYFDNAAFNLTTTAGANPLVGAAAQAQASADAIGRALLTGQVA